MKIDQNDLQSSLDEIVREIIKLAEQAPKITATITIDQSTTPATISADYDSEGSSTKSDPEDTSVLSGKGDVIDKFGENVELGSRFKQIIAEIRSTFG